MLMLSTYFRTSQSLFNEENNCFLFITRYDLFVLFGNGNGAFTDPIMTEMESGIISKIIVTGHFNDDDMLDIVVGNTVNIDIRILLGDGNGTFIESTGFSAPNCGILTSISLADFNNDNYSDIALTCTFADFVTVFFGNDNGTFSDSITLYTGLESYPTSTVIADFNNDNYIDLAVVNANRNIGVFLGHGDGSFQIQKRSFTGAKIIPMYIAVGDFNEDSKQDVAFSYQGISAIGVMFGDGNGTFDKRQMLMLNIGYSGSQIIVSDFNNDHHLDIGAFTYYSYTLNIFFLRRKWIHYIRLTQAASIIVS